MQPVDPSKLLPKIHQLPVLPTAIAEILRVTNDPSSSSQDVEWAVSHDQAVTAKVLKIINSAAYGFSRKVETIREASVMLGLRKMRDIAASMAAAELFTSDDTGMVQGNRLWIHGLACSIWAREILTIKRLSGMDVVVTAGLLHDIGIMILHQYCREHYHAVLAKAQEINRPHHRVEKKLLGISHAKLGAQLCAKWQLPDALVQLIDNHHSTLMVNEPQLAVLILADHLASSHSFGPFTWDTVSKSSSIAYEFLKFNEQEAAKLEEKIEPVTIQVSEFAKTVFPGASSTD